MIDWLERLQKKLANLGKKITKTKDGFLTHPYIQTYSRRINNLNGKTKHTYECIQETTSSFVYTFLNRKYCKNSLY